MLSACSLDTRMRTILSKNNKLIWNCQHVTLGQISIQNRIPRMPATLEQRWDRTNAETGTILTSNCLLTWSLSIPRCRSRWSTPCSLPILPRTPAASLKLYFAMNSRLGKIFLRILLWLWQTATSNEMWEMLWREVSVLITYKMWTPKKDEHLRQLDRVETIIHSLLRGHTLRTEHRLMDSNKSVTKCIVLSGIILMTHPSQ